jgi:hypothetical protein
MASPGCWSNKKAMYQAIWSLIHDLSRSCYIGWRGTRAEGFIWTVACEQDRLRSERSPRTVREFGYPSCSACSLKITYPELCHYTEFREKTGGFREQGQGQSEAKGVR